MTYEFSTSSNTPCDRCDGMEGVYDFPPDVPVHPECACVVTRIDDSGTDGHCWYEVRDLQFEEERYTESESWPVDNPENTAHTIGVAAEPEIVESYLDEGVQEALEWTLPAARDSVNVEVPARTRGEIDLEVEYAQVVCVGKRWRICSQEDPIAGVKVTETEVGTAGGMLIARLGIVEAELDADPSDDRDPGPLVPYFDDSAEVPT